MADLRIDGRKKVKTLKADFKKAFGASLRVYTTAACKTPANDDATLASLMAKSGAKGGEATFGSNLRVGTFRFTLFYLLLYVDKPSWHHAGVFDHDAWNDGP